MANENAVAPCRAFLLYFGCWGQAGHHLWDRNKSTVYRPEEFGYPVTAEALDASAVFLPRPERPGAGALTHVLRGDYAYTVLAWWGSPWDSRGRVNSAVIASGWSDVDDIWTRFSAVYPSLVPHLTRPTLEGPTHG